MVKKLKTLLDFMQNHTDEQASLYHRLMELKNTLGSIVTPYLIKDIKAKLKRARSKKIGMGRYDFIRELEDRVESYERNEIT